MAGYPAWYNSAELTDKGVSGAVTLGEKIVPTRVSC